MLGPSTTTVSETVQTISHDTVCPTSGEVRVLILSSSTCKASLRTISSFTSRRELRGLRVSPAHRAVSCTSPGLNRAGVPSRDLPNPTKTKATATPATASPISAAAACLSHGGLPRGVGGLDDTDFEATVGGISSGSGDAARDHFLGRTGGGSARSIGCGSRSARDDAGASWPGRGTTRTVPHLGHDTLRPAV